MFMDLHSTSTSSLILGERKKKKKKTYLFADIFANVNTFRVAAVPLIPSPMEHSLYLLMCLFPLGTEGCECPHCWNTLLLICHQYACREKTESL